MTETSAAPSAADSRQQLLELIKDKAIVHGRVTLSSGKEADYYVDLRRITLDGEAAPLVGEVMRDLTADLDFDAVGGLTLGADPVATAMLHAAAAPRRALDAFVVRKAGKAHGLQQRIEGPSIAGRRVRRRRGHLDDRRLAARRGRRPPARPGAEVVAVATIADRATGAAGEDRGAGLCVPSRRTASRSSAWPEPSARRLGRGLGSPAPSTAGSSP